MKYKLLKFEFYTGLHIGNGMLTDADPVFYADTLFSALCHEAIYMPGGIERLYQTFCQGNLRISDAMPYIQTEYYIPKPIITICSDEGDSVKKKAFKKLKYIPIEKLDEYLAGEMDPVSEGDKYSGFGAYEMRTNVRIHSEDDAEPFHVGLYHFQENAGLYICVAYKREEDFDYLMEIMESLALAGIGGKRSSGFGKFDVKIKKCPDSLEKRLREDIVYQNYISLSLTVPKNDEIGDVCRDAAFLLRKRSGFISSTSYSKEFQKKQTMYVFSPGSVFCKKFEGDIFDVSGNKGTHSVYRYAYPLFMGVMKA